MTMMNPKTIVKTLLFLLIILLQISNVVFSLEAYVRKDYKSEYVVRPGTVTHIVVTNDLHGLKKGNAGFVCAHGPKVWRKSKPGDRYVVLRFEDNSKIRYKNIHCHLRSNRGFVNVPLSIHPDTSAMCYPSYVCHYSIRKEGVYYKPERKLYPWRPFQRSAKGRRPKV